VAVRLNKFLADRGVGSRRRCDRLIAEGRVRINGRAVSEPGTKVEEQRDRVSVDGRPVGGRERPVYYVLNKPVGVITTLDDPQRRRTVRELLPRGARVFPVGRLDADTSGLLLLTNDGELTQLLTHPSFGVVKTYFAEVEGDPAPVAVRRLREGVELDDGVTAPARVKVVQRRATSAAVEIGIHEGRNRQVRRMCEAVGHPVRRLVRTRIGPLHDRRLQPGEWRPLSAGEVRRLYEAAANEANSPGGENAPG